MSAGSSWLRSSTPEDHKDVSFVCADSGQFLFEDAGGKLCLFRIRKEGGRVPQFFLSPFGSRSTRR